MKHEFDLEIKGGYMSDLKTFTNDSLHGKRNSTMDKMMEKFKEECQPILNKFVKECVKNNIEYCSINGALYEELFSMILSARLQTAIDLSEEGIIVK